MIVITFAAAEKRRDREWRDKCWYPQEVEASEERFVVATKVNTLKLKKEHKSPCVFVAREIQKTKEERHWLTTSCNCGV